MPTTSIAGPLTLTNLGAVSTTFSAPDTCATHWKNGIHGSGHEDLVAGEEPVYVMFEAGTCGDRFKPECFPHGEKVNTFPDFPEAMPQQMDYTQQMYYSPAYNCPVGWSTVGVAAMADGSASVSGVFTPTSALEASTISWARGGIETLYPRNWRANMITSALGPDETAIICCPSGFTAELYHPGCYAAFYASSLSGSQGCTTERAVREITLTVVATLEDTHGASETIPIPGQDSLWTPLSVSLSTDTWEYGSETFTTTHTKTFEPASAESVDTETWTFDASGRPTDFSNRTMWSQLFMDYEFVGAAVQPWLVFIHNADDEGAPGNGGDNDDDDDSAAHATPLYSLWAMAGALVAGGVVVASL